MPQQNCSLQTLEAELIAQDLEDLLKERKLTVGHPILLFAIILEESKKLWQENPNLTVSQVLTSNESWIGLDAVVISNDLNNPDHKSIKIDKDEKLKINELKIVYFDRIQVNEF